MSEGMETIERWQILKEWLKLFIVLAGWYCCYTIALATFWNPIIGLLQKIGEDKSPPPHIHIPPQNISIFIILIALSLSALIFVFNTIIAIGRNHLPKTQKIILMIFLSISICLWFMLFITIPLLLLFQKYALP
jgi:hypothetical protein